MRVAGAVLCLPYDGLCPLCSARNTPINKLHTSNRIQCSSSWSRGTKTGGRRATFNVQCAMNGATLHKTQWTLHKTKRTVVKAQWSMFEVQCNSAQNATVNVRGTMHWTQWSEAMQLCTKWHSYYTSHFFDFLLFFFYSNYYIEKKRDNNYNRKKINK